MKYEARERAATAHIHRLAIDFKWFSSQKNQVPEQLSRRAVLRKALGDNGTADGAAAERKQRSSADISRTSV